MGNDRKTVYSSGPEQGDEESPFSALRGQYGAGSEPGSEPAPAASRPKVSANPAAARPALQANSPVRVSRERKGRGGKTVSIITGVKSPQSGREALLKLLKNKLGTGGALEDEAIVIQGDHRERIVEILNDLGYKAKVAGG